MKEVKLRGVEARSYEATFLCSALEQCTKENYLPLFVPEFVDGLIGSDVFPFEFYTGSVIVFGRVGSGWSSDAKVVVAHVPNYFMYVNNLRTSIGQGVREGACKMPVRSFSHLLSKANNDRVFVLDSREVPNNPVMSINELLDSKFVHAFLGGVVRAEKYLTWLQSKGVSSVSLGVHFTDFMDTNDCAHARFLAINNSGLYADRSMNATGAFVARRRNRGIGQFLEDLFGR